MNLGVSELLIIVGIIACIGLVVGGAVVGIVYFMNNRGFGTGPG